MIEAVVMRVLYAAGGGEGEGRWGRCRNRRGLGGGGGGEEEGEEGENKVGGGRRKERRGRTRSEEEVRGEDDDARKGGMKEERRGVQWNNLWGVRRTDSLASAYQFAE